MGACKGCGLRSTLTNAALQNIGTITRTLWEYNHGGAPIDSPTPLISSSPSSTALLSSSSSTESGVARLAQSAVVAIVRSGGNLGLEALSSTDKRDVQQLQAHQVSAISIGNASGRIIIGLLSDLLVRRTGEPRYRVWMLMLVCALALASQAIAAAPNVITTIDKLMAVSILTGLSYGSLMGYAPILTFEWFGLKNFSQVSLCCCSGISSQLLLTHTLLALRTGATSA